MLLGVLMLAPTIILGFIVFSENNKMFDQIVNHQKSVRELTDAQHRRMLDIEKSVSKAVERIARLEKKADTLSTKLDDSMIAVGDLRDSLKTKKPAKRTK